MRFVSRLHLCAAASIFMVLYFAWLHQSTTFRPGVTVFWKASNHRVVVFGNDWSDTGSSRPSSISRLAMSTINLHHGEVWVETLCQELACDSIESFASSYLSDPETCDFGPLVDARIHAQAKYGEGTNVSLNFFDFKAQVNRFLGNEGVRSSLAQRLRPGNQSSLFTVYFGLWDILEYSTLEYEPASRAIENSIFELFKSLDILSEHVSHPINVVIPQVIDLTFLPWVQSLKFRSHENFAEQQHRMIFLVRYWNDVLLRTAKEWKNGQVYIPDPNALITEQVRIAQLFAQEMSDTSGVGRQVPLFREVEKPCLSLGKTTNEKDVKLAVEMCHDPSQYLFWDDIRLGEAVHHLIGEEAAMLVREYQSVNNQLMQSSVAMKVSEDQGAAGFNLKFPPGY